MNRLALLLVIGLIVAGQAHGGSADSLSVGPRPTLTILANADSAAVYIDSMRVGYAPVVLDSLTPGLHHVAVQPPDASNWLATGQSDTVHLLPGETRTLNFRIQQWFSLISIPSGASVFARDSLQGTTPLLISPAEAALDSAFVLRKPGFEDLRVSLSGASRGIVTAVLHGSAQPNMGDTKTVSPLRIYASGAIAVLAGAASAYFKIRADAMNGKYMASGDPALLDRTHRLDTAAAISLVVTQAGMLLFSYFLLSE